MHSVVQVLSEVVHKHIFQDHYMSIGDTGAEDKNYGHKKGKNIT